MNALRLATVIVLGATGIAVADPAPAADPAPSPPLPSLQFAPLPLVDIPQQPTEPSVRIDAARVVAERFAEDWRYPEPGSVLGVQNGLWYFGVGTYQPKSRRSAALHTGSVAATIIGEILLAADSPLAGVGAMLTGVTLDAAAADADRAAEARGH